MPPLSRRVLPQHKDSSKPMSFMLANWLNTTTAAHSHHVGETRTPTAGRDEGTNRKMRRSITSLMVCSHTTQLVRPLVADSLQMTYP
jgi:hypothetical protein